MQTFKGMKCAIILKCVILVLAHRVPAVRSDRRDAVGERRARLFAAARLRVTALMPFALQRGLHGAAVERLLLEQLLGQRFERGQTKALIESG